MADLYYEVDDRTDTTVTVDAKWAKRVKGAVFCPQCSNLRRGSAPIDVMVNEIEGGFALASTLPFCLTVLSTAFIDAIGRTEVERAFEFRRLLRPDGRAHPEYSVAYGRESTYIRASAKSEHWVCTGCGHSTYFGVGSRYTTRAVVGSNVGIYEEVGGRGLIINHTLRQRLGREWDSFLKFYKLPIREHAMDGLPDVWPMYPTEEQLRGYVPRKMEFKNSSTK